MSHLERGHVHGGIDKGMSHKKCERWVVMDERKKKEGDIVIMTLYERTRQRETVMVMKEYDRGVESINDNGILMSSYV